jgi:hypothetical protein
MSKIFVPEQDVNEKELSLDFLDDEDIGRTDSGFTPWDPTKIRITTKHISLRDIVDQISENEIDLSPDFQRDYVWKNKQRTRLIESILLGIPLPAFYFNQDKDGTYQVVDGVQRLSTIALFMNDKHVLDRVDLEYLHGQHESIYSQLDPATQRRFRSTQIVVHIIEPQTPDEVKYDIFGRVNTLGSPLSAQEIRHAMSKPRSRKLLKDLAESPSFDKATEGSFWRKSSSGEYIRDSSRMTNRELALRFCAFRNYSDTDYRKHSGLDAYLVEFTRRLDGRSEMGNVITDSDFEKLKFEFEQAMTNAHKILGKSAFRRNGLADKRRGPINRAVFESQAIAFADYSLSQLIPKKAEIEMALKNVFTETAYLRSTTVGTGDPKAIQIRMHRIRKILAEIVN